MAYELRARGIGALIDATFWIYRKYWWPLVMTAGVLLLPASLIQAGMQYSLRGTMMHIQQGVTYPGADYFADIFRIYAYTLPPLLLMGLAKIFAEAAVIKATADACLEGRADFAAAWRRVKERFGSILLVGITTNIFLGVAFICCCLPYVFVWVFLAGAMPAAALEMTDTGQSLSRSFKMLKANYWHAFGVFLVMELIMLVPYMLLSFATQYAMYGTNLFNPQALAGARFDLNAYYLTIIFTAIFQVVIAPVISIAKTLVYFDLRIKQEGFDLERAAANSGARTEDGPGAPIS